MEASVCLVNRLAGQQRFEIDFFRYALSSEVMVRCIRFVDLTRLQHGDGKQWTL